MTDGWSPSDKPAAGWETTLTPEQVYRQAMYLGLGKDRAVDLMSQRQQGLAAAPAAAPAASSYPTTPLPSPLAANLGGGVGTEESTISPDVALAAAMAGLPSEYWGLLEEGYDASWAADVAMKGSGMTFNNLVTAAEDLAKRVGTSGGGAAGGGVSTSAAYDANRQFWLDQIEAGLATQEQAEKAFTRWATEEGVKLAAQQEAGQRAGDVNAILEARARETMPEETVSGLNALIAKVTGNLGLPAVKLPAQAASAYPDPWAAYGQGMSSVGLAAAPPVPTFQIPSPPSPGPAGVATGVGELPSSGSAGIDALLQRLLQQANSGGQPLPVPVPTSARW